MAYKILFHLCWLIVSLVTAAIFSMAMYTFELGKFMPSYWAAFGLLETIHLLLLATKQFQKKAKALLLNSINFAMLGLMSGFMVYMYSNLNSWRVAGMNLNEFNYFPYFFDNIFLVNLIIFIINFWFLCRNLVLGGFK